MTIFDRSLWRRCARLALALLLSWSALGQAAPVATGWAKTETRAHPTGNATFKAYVPDTQTIDIAVALKLRNRADLEKRVHAMTTPGNPEYRKWMSHHQILSDYAPTADRAQAVADYLTQKGFTNVQIEPNRLMITATGTAKAVQRAFHTRLGRYTEEGREGIANMSDALIPPALSDTVLSVLGLQTLHHMKPLNTPAVTVQLTGSVHGLNPVKFPIAYNAASMPSASTTPVGIITVGDMTQTIADLHQFETQHGLPTINPTIVYPGPRSRDTSGTPEWDLDTQSIQAMAGGQVSEMVLYAAASFSDSRIAQAINKAVTDNNVAIINVSLGICEAYAYSDGSMAANDQAFQVAIAQGQTFSVSTGDNGSKECGNPTGTAVGASYPASSPYVIAVGGTTLYTDSAGNYGGEVAWSDTGGSPSLYEPKPSWQDGVVSGSYRGLPDIAFDADPYSGAIIIVNGATAQYGGTSLASPLFVGSWARIQTANGARLGFPATWIYSHGTAHTSAFRDVTSGSNGDYSAAAGWDYTTGFGSFDVAATAALTRPSITISASPKSVIAGQNVTFTATVSGNSPTGTVQFQINGVDFGSPVTLVNGVATLTTNQLTVTGTDTVTAVYSGDYNNAGTTTATGFTEIVTLGHDGDINGDAVVNVVDVMLAQQIASGQKTATVSELAHGDVAPLSNGLPAPDGTINVADVLVIERKVSGFVTF